MLTYQEEIRAKYPHELSQENIRCILRINKNRLSKMLQDGIIKSEIRNFTTHQYIIKVDDLILYLDSIQEKTPSLFITDKEHFQRWLEMEWSQVKNVLSNKDIARLTGYTVKRVNNWILQGKIKCIETPNEKLIPKAWVIDFYTTDALRTKCKSTKHLTLLNKYLSQKQL